MSCQNISGLILLNAFYRIKQIKIRKYNFISIFSIQQIVMRNPFLNTEGYTIMKQFNRINNKGRENRSNSIISQKSQWSGRKSRSSSCCSQKQNIYGSHNRYRVEYLTTNDYSPVYDLETRRVQVFGIQQLRYKPSYFQQINSYKPPQEKSAKTCKKQEIAQTSASLSKKLNILKSMKSMKAAKSTKSIGFSLNSQNFNYQENSISDKVVEKPINKKRGSVVEEMINLNTDKLDTCNFYASADNYKSHFDLNMLHPPSRKQNKKLSLFSNFANDISESNFSRSYNNYQQEMDTQNQTSQQGSKYTEQIEYKISEAQQNKVKIRSKLKIKQQKPPNKISIRNKIYYRYCS